MDNRTKDKIRGHVCVNCWCHLNRIFGEKIKDRLDVLDMQMMIIDLYAIVIEPKKEDIL